MTKQLNKKGTSLVELIAVIVIMGIIAGIAIPTTIAVINRQKKNSATKSAKNVLESAKTILLEASANGAASGVTADSADSGVLITVDGTTKTYKINDKGLVALGELEKSPFDTEGSFVVELSGTNTFTVSGTYSINDYSLVYNTTTGDFSIC